MAKVEPSRYILRMPVPSRPLPNSQFSGFLDDELGKLANLSPAMFARLRASKDPYRELQSQFNQVKLDVLNTYLLNVALFADPILTVDGWMILTPDWWDSFMEPEVNLLPQMLKCGLVRSFTRYDGDLTSLADREAKKGIVTYERLIKSDQTKERYPVLQKFLARYDDLDVVRYVKWPGFDMDQVMKKVVVQTILDSFDPLKIAGLDLTQRGFDHLRERFYLETSPLPGSKGPRNSTRQAWMLAVLNLLSDDGFWIDGKPSLSGIRALASLGVEAYHGSRAIALNAESPNLSVDVSSLPQKIMANFEDDGDVCTPQLLEDGLISLTMSWNDFPKDRCSMLRDLEDPTSMMGSRKLRFLATRDAYIARLRDGEGGAGKVFHAYEAAAKDYINVLNAAFETRVAVSATGTSWRCKQFLDSMTQSSYSNKVISKTLSKALVQIGDQYVTGGHSAPEIRAGLEASIEVFLQDSIGKLHFNSKKVKIVDYKSSPLDRAIFRKQYINKVNVPLVAPSRISTPSAEELVKGVDFWQGGKLVKKAEPEEDAK